MYSHLILSLKAYSFYSFPLSIHIVEDFIWSYMGKVWSYQDIINEMLSKQDKLLMVLPRLVKKVIGNNVISRRGKRKNTHTLR
jgi:hypothetical protein